MADLPAIRQELGLSRAPAGYDGEPLWTLHDPATNRFFQIGWPVFEILSRWWLRRSDALVAVVNNETTLGISADDVEDVARFLNAHNLLVVANAEGSARLEAAALRARPSPLNWLLHNYLFFRIPLIRPMPLLRALYPLVAFVYSRTFFAIVLAVAITGLFLVSRQWDAFTHTFGSYFNLEGALAFAVTLVFAKVLHELGHALTAYRYGCNVPQMGLAFLLMWPMLYTDTSEAWKLASRRQRFAIGAAGIAAELILAAFATLAWSMLPDGPLRAAAFVLATSTWVLTIAINASPFTRFDGYFLLADWLNLPNLHERSFALARWWLRETLFGFGDAPPEDFAPARRHRLIVLALFTWAYRLVLFVGIALLLGHFVFKALGIVLMLVELGYFVARPITREFGAWWARRADMRFNLATLRTLLLLAGLAAVLFMPWRSTISLPAVLVDAQAQSLYAPHGAQLQQLAMRQGQTVAAGETLAVLAAPDLAAEMDEARVAEATLRLLVEQQPFSGPSEGAALRRQWESARERLEGAEAAITALTLRAPLAGRVADIAPGLVPGVWIGQGEWLLLVAGGSVSRGEAFVGDADLQRLADGAAVRFVPDMPEAAPAACRVEGIDRVNLSQIDQPAVASFYGGPISARRTQGGGLAPLEAVYRVRFAGCAPAMVEGETSGRAHIDAAPQSIAAGLWRQLAGWARREFAL